jgi:hypothetical protein
MRNRKAQEEIIGFVMIVLIVSVIFLIFIGISLRRSGNEEPAKSKDIYQFLESSMRTTSECTINYGSAYLSIGELLQRCYQDKDLRTNTKCSSGGNACDVLNKTLSNIFDISWQVSPEAVIKGYEFTSTQSQNISQKGQLPFVTIKKGICGFNKFGEEYLVSAYPSGSIVNRLNLCY